MSQQLSVHQPSYVKNGLIKSPGRLKWLFVAFFLVTLSYFILRRPEVGLCQTEAQYIILPFLLLLLCFIPWPSGKMQKALPAIALLASGVTAFFLFTTVSFRTSEFVISRFQGDEFDMKSSLFREHIQNRIQSSESGSAGRIMRVVGDHQKAQQLLKGGKASALIWGNKNWANLTFQKDAKGEALPIKIAGKTYQLIKYVPAIGIPFKEAYPAAEFTSLLLMAEQEDPLVGDSYLRSAALYRGRWTTFAHLAYPNWRLGNSHLENYLQRGRTERAELLCALEAYSQGASHLQPGDNPHLRAALFANKAIALLLLNESKSAGKKEAKSLFKKAAQISSREDPFGAKANMHKLIVENLDTLRMKNN